MRLSAIFIRLLVFVVVGIACLATARATVAIVENRSVIAVQEVLVDRGYEWASVLGDGLQVILEGQAPTEAVRFRAISAAGTVVDASRVIDNLSVLETQTVTPPEFAIEMLRNNGGVSLIGLVPTSTNRAALISRITRIAAGQPVTDLLEVANYPEPDTWNEALAYSLRALGLMDKSKISVTAAKVDISGIADDPAEKRRLETALARNAPTGVTLAIAISSPRPVITPFTVRAILEDDRLRFDACAADSDEAVSKIAAAAAEAGFGEPLRCELALGAPTREWGDAVAMALRSLAQLGGGTLTISDTDMVLVAKVGTEQRAFDNAIGTLSNALPEAFALRATLPTTAEEAEDVVPEFTATLSPEGNAQLRGRVPDDMANVVARNFAEAKFGSRNVAMGTRVASGLPNGWTIRVLAGIEALSYLSNGIVQVTAEDFTVRGNTGNTDAKADITRHLIEKLGQGARFVIDVTYVEALDPLAAIPTPEECITRINTITASNKITFDPGSADLTAATQPVVDAIAEILKECGDLPIRIAGYTDSQGREIMNLQLSQNRADAVLTALRARRVPTSTFESIGFGEENPIADNGTEEGREANRRIEFSLIAPPVEAEASDAATAESAATEAEAAGTESTTAPDAGAESNQDLPSVPLPVAPPPTD